MKLDQILEAKYHLAPTLDDAYSAYEKVYRRNHRDVKEMNTIRVEHIRKFGDFVSMIAYVNAEDRSQAISILKQILNNSNAPYTDYDAYQHRDHFWKVTAQYAVPKIYEAKYAGHRDQWFQEAETIAKNNVKKHPREHTYWSQYVRWLNDNYDTLQSLYESIKADRNTFIHNSALSGEGVYNMAKVWSDVSKMMRMKDAETWSGMTDQYDYKQYRQLIVDKTNTELDYALMATNTMIDLLGGLRDER